MTGTIVTGLVLAAITAAIIVKIVRDKRSGHCAGCTLGCGSCQTSNNAKQ